MRSLPPVLLLLTTLTGCCRGLPVKLEDCTQASHDQTCETVARFQDWGSCNRWSQFRMAQCNANDPKHVVCDVSTSHKAGIDTKCSQI